MSHVLWQKPYASFLCGVLTCCGTREGLSLEFGKHVNYLLPNDCWRYLSTNNLPIASVEFRFFGLLSTNFVSLLISSKLKMTSPHEFSGFCRTKDQKV